MRSRPAIVGLFLISLSLAACARSTEERPIASPTAQRGAHAEPRGSIDLSVELPRSGLVVEDDDELVFVGMDGSVVARLPRLTLDTRAHHTGTPGPLLVADEQQQLFLVTGSAKALRSVDEPIIALADDASIVWTRDRARIERAGDVLWQIPPRTPVEISAHRDVVSAPHRDGMRALNVRSGEFTDLPDGCSVADRVDETLYLLCPHPNTPRPAGDPWRPTVDTLVRSRETRTLIEPLELADGQVMGRWRRASVSRDGSWIVAQWSGECEIPTVVFAPSSGGDAIGATGERKLLDTPSSRHIGWSDDGRAVVHFDEGACGSGIDKPGVYFVSEPGDLELIYETSASTVEMWR